MSYTKEINMKSIIFSIISIIILTALLIGGALIELYSYNSDYIEPLIKYDYVIEKDKITVTIKADANIKDFSCDIRFCTLFDYFDHKIKIDELQKNETKEFEFSTQAISSKLENHQITWLNFLSTEGKIRTIDYINISK